MNSDEKYIVGISNYIQIKYTTNFDVNKVDINAIIGFVYAYKVNIHGDPKNKQEFLETLLEQLKKHGIKEGLESGVLVIMERGNKYFVGLYLNKNAKIKDLKKWAYIFTFNFEKRTEKIENILTNDDIDEKLYKNQELFINRDNYLVLSWLNRGSLDKQFKKQI